MYAHILYIVHTHAGTACKELSTPITSPSNDDYCTIDGDCPLGYTCTSINDPISSFIFNNDWMQNLPQPKIIPNGDLILNIFHALKGEAPFLGANRPNMLCMLNFTGVFDENSLTTWAQNTYVLKSNVGSTSVPTFLANMKVFVPPATTGQPTGKPTGKSTGNSTEVTNGGTQHGAALVLAAVAVVLAL